MSTTTGRHPTSGRFANHATSLTPASRQFVGQTLAHAQHARARFGRAVSRSATLSNVDGVCSLYADIYYELEAEAQSIEACIEPTEARLRANDLLETLENISHQHARRLSELVDQLGAEMVVAQVQQHAVHRDFLLRSAFIRRALEKPRGYAGDMELMLMICGQDEHGPDLFSTLINQVYLRLPASEAVRRRIEFLTRQLDDLPIGSSILNVACGPALEVQQARQIDRCAIDLLDHDPETIEYLTAHGVADGNRIRALRGNAFKLMAGDYRALNCTREGQALECMLEPQYDLIYSAGLYDYVPDGDGVAVGAKPLTRRLFNLLRPGGRLLIGNYLAVASDNPHLRHHRTMMEAYSEWNLLYRTPEEIRAFANSLPEAEFTVSMIDESGARLSETGPSTIAFLDIRRC